MGGSSRDMGRLEKSQWGHNINNELKYTYEKAYKEAEVKNISMSKEEFDKYIKELEMKESTVITEKSSNNIN